jgi:RNA polymerase sigma-70 factor, ECF subfamily
MTTRGAGSGEPMERLSATERLKALLPNPQPRSGNPLGDLPDIGRSEEPPSVKRHAMNLLSPSLAITNAIQTRGLAAPTRVDHDGELLAALRRRDRTAAECLVARYGDRAYRLAMGITRNAQDAEETVQDALWSVIQKIDTFRGDSSLGSWIYRIVANAAYQKLRGPARRRDEISLDEVLPLFHEDGRHAGPISDWSASIQDPAMQTELRAALVSAIGELPAAYRAVIILRDVEGLSMAEVAGSLGITVAAAKSRAHRARLFLRQRLAIFMSGATASIGAPSQEGHLRRPDVIEAHLES